jgi:hypothetical protein
MSISYLLDEHLASTEDEHRDLILYLPQTS